MYDPNGIIINIDGSAYGNPGHEGGMAGIVEYPEALDRKPERIFNKGFLSTTNNRMELTAAIWALEWARKNVRSLKAQSVTLVSDSRYLCNNYRNALYWKKSKWQNKEGRLIENHDLWDRFLSAQTKVGVRVEIEWQKGKISDVAKEVDKFAKDAAKRGIKTRDAGYRSGKIAKTKIRGSAASMYHALGQAETIRVYRKDFKFVGKRQEAKIFFEVLSARTGTFESKEVAYASLEIENELHRSHVYRVRFNNKPRYPIIEKIIKEVRKY